MPFLLKLWKRELLISILAGLAVSCAKHESESGAVEQGNSVFAAKPTKLTVIGNSLVSSQEPDGSWIPRVGITSNEQRVFKVKKMIVYCNIEKAPVISDMYMSPYLASNSTYDCYSSVDQLKKKHAGLGKNSFTGYHAVKFSCEGAIGRYSCIISSAASTRKSCRSADRILAVSGEAPGPNLLCLDGQLLEVEEIKSNASCINSRGETVRYGSTDGSHKCLGGRWPYIVP